MALDVVEADPATNFTSDEFENLADRIGIAIKTEPTEEHKIIGSIEHQHEALRAVYEKFKLDTQLMPKFERLTWQFALSMILQMQILGFRPLLKCLVSTLSSRVPEAWKYG